MSASTSTCFSDERRRIPRQRAAPASATFPHAMLATATHDHKRGEDVRARLAVLSEQAPTNGRACCRAGSRNAGRCAAKRAARCFRTQATSRCCCRRSSAPGRSISTFGIGTGGGHSPSGWSRWQEKALREAKLATDWAVPNEAYEHAARAAAATRCVAGDAAPALLTRDRRLSPTASAPAGAVNGLAQTLLKLTVPGVPDIYQGTEFWDFSLVDPDNRRPVDFARARPQARRGPPEDLAQTWRDGRIKQALIARTLALRRSTPELFAEGSYEPLEVRGTFADHVIAFARRLGRRSGDHGRAAHRISVARCGTAFASSRMPGGHDACVARTSQALINMFDRQACMPQALVQRRPIARALSHSRCCSHSTAA